MVHLKTLLFLAWLALPISALANDTFYVDPSGNNSNPGTASQPWRTIQFAVTKVTPGDTVLVGNGTYREKVIITRSGTPDNYIVLKSINRWGAKVEIAETGKTDGIKIAANYVTVDGFEIYDPNLGPERHGNCITVWENHHVNILNNKVHDCGGAGIQVGRFDYVLIENNVAYGNAKYNPNQSSGIGLFQARAVDNLPGYHIIVRNNRSYDNINIVLSSNNNIGTTDGNGIIVDNFENEGADAGPYPHRTLIENNLSYNNGGKGVHLFKSDYVDVFNNTSFHNNTDTRNTGTWRAELSLVYSKDTVWRNNIGVANPGDGVLAWNRAILIARSEDMIWENNISYNGSAGDISVNFSGTSVGESDLANNLLGVNPMFNNAANGDFTLQSNSPAIDAGSDQIVSFGDIDYKAREAGKVDIGAFEWGDPAATNDEEDAEDAGIAEVANHPNPFRSITDISYNVTRPEIVRIDVFNGLGQHVTTLVNAEQPAGNHAATFDGSNLPNGLYYYRIVAGQSVTTRAMVLVK